MTDGILLAELQRDRMLRAYDTIIIDEAHERSLNIDFILGYLAQLLPKRPDLKVIVTSATIETERFSAHFGGAPVIEVSGRTFPVEIRYRPLDDQGGDQVAGITDAVRELRRAGPGDVLVFLSGEREIHDTADALRALDLADTEVLPLYARLSSAEQHRVFSPTPDAASCWPPTWPRRRITVPASATWSTPGTARISRYSQRLKVQRLPIEAVSQASADQRAGRCGRVADGICIRLYERGGLRPPDRAYTEPEILRTNLASVILQMTAIGLGDIAAFPFLDPPDRQRHQPTASACSRSSAHSSRRGEGAGPARRSQPRRTAPHPDRSSAWPGCPSTRASGAWCSRPGSGTGACARCWSSPPPSRSRTPVSGPAEKARPADQLHARFADGVQRLPRLRGACGATCANSSASCRATASAALPRRAPQLPAHPGVAGRPQPAAHRGGRPRHMTQNREAADPDEVHRALLSGLLSHVGHEGPRDPRVPRCPQRPLRHLPRARRWPGSRRHGSWPPSWWRPPACSPAPSPASSRSGPRSWAPTSCPAATASRTGRPRGAAAMAHERVDALRPPARHRPPRAATAGSTPSTPASCSSATPSWRATGRPTTRIFRRNRDLLDEVEDLEHRFRRRDLADGDERPSNASTTSASRRRGGVGPPLRLVVEEGEAAQTPTCSPSPSTTCSPPPADELSDADFPARVGPGRSLALGLSLPLRARLARRRRGRPRARRRAQPAGPRGVRLARARVARRAGHDARAGPAQGPAPQPRRRLPTTCESFLAEHGPADGPMLPLLSRHMGRAAGTPIPVDAWESAASRPTCA